MAVTIIATDDCRWCGEHHDGPRCPWVKALEFNGIGDTVTRVEFLTPVDMHPQLPAEVSAQDYERLKPGS